MYIPTFQGLTAADFLPTGSGRAPARRYPFDVPHRTFYRARNAIYHLFRALQSAVGPVTVLVPDYNSGNEVLALEAAGATVRYMPVGPDGQLDVAQVEESCEQHRPDVLYVIHYLGWPQPIRALADLSRRLGIWLVEDCALALMSDADRRPLGTFGHWSVFCLYKTLPLPNGACLMENDRPLPGLDEVQLHQAGFSSVAGRTTELVVRKIRTRSDSFGAAMASMKRAAGRSAAAVAVPRANVGDLGFNLDEVNLAMSDISCRLVKRLDLEHIRARRIANYTQLAARLQGRVSFLRNELPPAVCPMVLPILVADKRQAADALREAGIEALEFWNHGAGKGDAEGKNATFLRRHVLGLPIHQDLSARHIDYVASQVLELNLPGQSFQ